MGTPLSPVTVPEVFRSFSFLKWPLLTKGFIAGDSTAYNSHTLPGDSPYYPWRAHRKLRDAYLWGGNLHPLITLRTLFWYSWSVYNLNNKRPGKRKENITIFIFIEFTTVTGDETGLTSQLNMKPFNIHPTHKRLYHTNGDYASYSYEQQYGFFFIAQESEQWKSCETGPTVFGPHPKRLEWLTICRCHNKGSTFRLLSLFKTLNVGPAGLWTCDLPLGRQALIQLS